MLDVSPAQKYAKAALRAEKDRNRPTHPEPVIQLGGVTLRELRRILGGLPSKEISLQQLADLIETCTGLRWSRGQLSRVETGARAMTPELRKALDTTIRYLRYPADRADLEGNGGNAA